MTALLTRNAQHKHNINTIFFQFLNFFQSLLKQCTSSIQIFVSTAPLVFMQFVSLCINIAVLSDWHTPLVKETLYIGLRMMYFTNRCNVVYILTRIWVDPNDSL